MTTRRDLLCLLALAPVARVLGEPTLYQQSLQAQLARLNPGVEILVHDIRAGQTLASTFASPAAVPIGSLFKPFLAFAYLSRARHPELGTTCRGHQDLCWKPGGHGSLSLPEALAQSCNAYFLAMAATLHPDEISLPTPPPSNATPIDLIGLTPRWLIAPHTVAAAYAELLPQAPDAILEGMRLAATTGTAQRIGYHPGGVLAKTGTAPCLPAPSVCKISGDGLVLAAVPASEPRLILITRHCGTTGSTTALSAGRVLRQLETLHAY